MHPLLVKVAELLGHVTYRNRSLLFEWYVIKLANGFSRVVSNANHRWPQKHKQKGKADSQSAIYRGLPKVAVIFDKCLRRLRMDVFDEHVGCHGDNVIHIRVNMRAHT